MHETGVNGYYRGKWGPATVRSPGPAYAAGDGAMAVEVTKERGSERDWQLTALNVGAALLALGTAYIHSTLGGTGLTWLMFTMNAILYTAGALALVAPIAFFSRFRWGVRLALLALALVTIGGWLLFGARYDMAYLSKAIEVVLIVVLLVALWRYDGGPAGIVAKLRALPSDLVDFFRGSR